jgi:hypothetical protein
VGVIVVVLLFLRSIRERDIIFHSMIKDLTHEIAALKAMVMERIPVKPVRKNK